MSAYKFRVLLDSDKNQEIFRDIVINREETFETFYNAIVASFNFTGDQMASFYMSNDEWDKGFEITLMDMSFDEDMPEPIAIMSENKLVDFVKDPDQKVILVYDFMRMWIFLIELIDIVKEPVDAAKVVMSVGIAPPEDSRMIDLEEGYEDEFDLDEDFEDEFGDEFEDGYDNEDYGNGGGYDDYDY